MAQAALHFFILRLNPITMFKRFVLCAGCMVSVCHAEVREPFNGFYSNFKSHTFSEPTSIDSILHDFRGDIRSGERAFTYNRVETGVQFHNVSVGYAMRYDYFLHFNEDVARAYHASTHDTVLPTNDVQQVKIEASHIRAKGAIVGWHWRPAESYGLQIKIARLEADRMVDGYADGALALTGENEYSGQVHFKLNSSEDLLLEMPVPDPEGRGYAMDLDFEWQISQQWWAGFQVLDAYSRIRWDDVLFSDLQANTATVTYDADGHLHTKPVLFGYQYLTDTTQKLPRKYSGKIQYQVNPKHGVYLEQFHVASYASLTSVGYEWTVTEQWRWGAYWNISTRAIGLTGRWHWLSLQLAADQADAQEAHALDLELGLQIPLSW